MIDHIHQIWFQGRTMAPEKYNLSFSKWQDLHPNANYHFWDENKIRWFIATHYPAYLDRWQALDPLIKKCDSARYFILHHYGGVYADADTAPLRPLDALISDLGLDRSSIIFSEESGDPASWKNAISREVLTSTDLEVIVGNALLISKPRQDFWIEFFGASI